MIDLTLLARIRIEPLDRNTHDRAAFSCGEPRIDNYISKSAANHQADHITRVRVGCLDTTYDVIAFYALNAHSIDVTTLPQNLQKKLPRFPSVPAVYLSMLGVHSELQGKGLGKFMMADAFKQAALASETIGACFLVLDALNDDAARMYASLKFVPLPSNPQRMILNMSQIVAAHKAATTTPLILAP